MKALILFIILLSQWERSFGLDLFPGSIYEATKDACLRVEQSDIAPGSFSIAKLRMGNFPSQNFNDILSYIKIKSMKKFILDLEINSPDPSVEYFIKHPEFNRALMECYPENPMLQLFFKQAISSSDKTGKLLGVMINVALFKGIGSIASLIKNMSLVSTIAFDKLNRIVTGFIGTLMLKRDSKSTTANDMALSFDNSTEINQKISESQKDRLIQVSKKEEQIKFIENAIHECNECEDRVVLLEQIKIYTNHLNKLKEIDQDIENF